jgi:hypothetical protein
VPNGEGVMFFQMRLQVERGKGKLLCGSLCLELVGLLRMCSNSILASLLRYLSFMFPCPCRVMLVWTLLPCRTLVSHGLLGQEVHR